MLVVVLALAADPRPPPDVATVVKAVVAAAGGEQAWRAAPCRVERGKVSTPKNVGTLYRAVAWPARLHLEVTYATNPTERRVLNGGLAWIDGQPVQGAQLAALTLQAARAGLPLILLDRKDELVDRGLTSRAGLTLRRLELPLGQDLWLEVEIDTTTHRVLTSTGHVGRLVMGVSYDDWRPVGALTLPFKEETFTNRAPTGVVTLDSVELSASLPTELFRN